MDVQKILEAAFKLFNTPDFLKKINGDIPESEYRKGGYICIVPNDASKAEDPVLALVMLGELTPEKQIRYYTMAQEKARRLQRSPAHILTSFETRKPELDQKGGALRTGKFILSFSGFTEETDELFMRMIAKTLHLP